MLIKKELEVVIWRN